MNRSAVLCAITIVALAGTASAQQMVGNCSVLPPDNIWNTPIDTLPVLSNSASMVNTIGSTRGFHPDFGANLSYGIPFITVPGTQTKYPASFQYADESDPGPYAIPLNAPIEGGSTSTGDRHALAIDTDNCILYELYAAYPQSASWTAGSGAIFDLKSNALRPLTWTSTDAAGLPLMPGLVTYEEVMSGEIRHAIRFTVPQTRNDFVWPARHEASSLTGSQYPRMGERFRLRATFDITPYPAEVQVILKAMKKYGIILADNGSAWYLTGKSDSRWNDTNLHTLGNVLGSNFEAVDATVLQISPDSGAAKQSGVSVTVSVTPSSPTVHLTKSQMFAATVSGATGGVTWSVNGVTGGNSTLGTIDANGMYTAPSVVPNPSTVTVAATSITAPSANGTASVTLLPLPSITSLNPSPLPTGSATLTVNGAGFDATSKVTFDGALKSTAYMSSTQLTATPNVSSPATGVQVRVMLADGTLSPAVSLDIVAVTVSVGVSPTSASVRVKQTRQFSATVQGTSNTAVTWKVNGIAGGNATIGTISSTGAYKAPSSVPNPATVTVSATSVVDPTKSAAASVTITRH